MNMMSVIGIDAYAIYNIIGCIAGQDTKAWPSVATMAKLAGCSESTVRRAIKKLIKHKLITKKLRAKADGGNTSNLYTIMPVYDFTPTVWSDHTVEGVTTEPPLYREPVQDAQEDSTPPVTETVPPVTGTAPYCHRDSQTIRS